MAQDNFKRKPTTILSVDVAGYSRLMGGNKAATVKTLEVYKLVISESLCGTRPGVGSIVDDTMFEIFGEERYGKNP